MRALFALALIVGCKDKAPAPAVVAKDAAVVADAAVVVDDDWKPRCKAALTAAANDRGSSSASIMGARRPREIIDNCRPCGDWSPLLRWDIPADAGGPTRDAIEAAMERCNAYCSTAAKQRFLNTLDEARGKPVRTPWRFLGELCGEAISAKPDGRYVSAPYFALDRIGRAAADDPELAKLLAQIELPLPPVSISGDGVAFPLAPVTKPETGRVHVTVAAGKLQYVGLLPRAKLTGTGVFVDHGAEPYPGAIVDGKGLATAYAKWQKTAPSESILVIAPSGLPARRIAEVLVPKQSFVLAAEIRSAPHGWPLLGHVPVAMVQEPVTRTSPTYVVTDAASVDAAIEKLKTATSTSIPTLAIAAGTATATDLAKLLGALAYRDIKRAIVIAQ